jgi:hypothetical protein
MPEHYPKCGADRNQQRGISKIMTCFSKELAIAKTKSMQLSDLKLSKNPLILVAEAPEKPEILVLRTAKRCNLDAVIIANQKQFIQSNIVRSSGLFIYQ